MTDLERDAFIAEQLNQGVKLSTIQTMLEKDFGIKLTFMELRLIASDLEVNWDKQGHVPREEIKVTPKAVKTPCETALITISKITKPGTMINGEVTFKSGNRAEWWIDSTGRPGLNPLEGYDPPEQEDIPDFSMRLQEVLAQQQGY